MPFVILHVPDFFLFRMNVPKKEDKFKRKVFKCIQSLKFKLLNGFTHDINNENFMRNKEG